MDQNSERGLAEQLRERARRWVAPADQWRTEVQKWVDAGIVSSQQGDEIVALETSHSSATSRAKSSEASRSAITPIVEVAAYVGITAVVLSTVLFLGHYWNRIGFAGHLSVAVMVMIAGLLGGQVVAQVRGIGARRLSSVLRLLGTAGAAMTTMVVVGPSTEIHRGLSLLCVGVVVLVLSAVLWRNLDRSLQFLSTVLGVALTLSAVGVVAHLHATSTEVALVVWFSSVAVGLMGLQMLRPAATALIVAELGSLVGAFALSFPNHLSGVLLGLFSSICAVGIGFALERPPIIVLGALGFFMFDFRIFDIYLRSTNAALGAFILGLVLVCVTLWRAAQSTTRGPREFKQKIRIQIETERREPR